jgi:MFS transporter, ACS family, glucarate transporter
VSATSALGAIYKGGPLWLGAVGCLVGGLLTDALVRRTGNLRWGRRLFGVVGHSLTGLCFLACPWAPNAFWFFVVISLAGFSTDLAMGAGWSVCQDIGRRYAGVVAGCMNMVGNLGGATAAWLSGFVLQHSLSVHAAALGIDMAALSRADQAAGLLRGYQINFLISAVIYAMGVVCWLRIDPTKAVDDEDNGPTPRF